MNKRNFIKMLAMLPFLGFLKPAKAEIPPIPEFSAGKGFHGGSQWDEKARELAKAAGRTQTRMAINMFNNSWRKVQ